MNQPSSCVPVAGWKVGEGVGISLGVGTIVGRGDGISVGLGVISGEGVMDERGDGIFVVCICSARGDSGSVD